MVRKIKNMDAWIVAMVGIIIALLTDNSVIFLGGLGFFVGWFYGNSRKTKRNIIGGRRGRR